MSTEDGPVAIDGQIHPERKILWNTLEAAGLTVEELREADQKLVDALAVYPDGVVRSTHASENFIEPNYENMVVVSLQDDEHRFLSILWERDP